VERLNDYARRRYYEECRKIVEQINAILPADEKLYVPDIRFNRHIGEFAGKHYSVDGRVLDSDQYEEHLRETLPNEEDEAAVAEIMKRDDWVAPKAA
jgi:benzoyl-CoA 2,3-dioxygenase component B